MKDELEIGNKKLEIRRVIPICYYTTEFKNYYYYNSNLKTQMRFVRSSAGIMLS